ncbi:hypothetical protein [Raoultella ornithinolytica]|uniref:hypothetical protein n=1 Tax=Raoultella ornithinolytica TaxID=54291 RepID=UPI00301DD57C
MVKFNIRSLCFKIEVNVFDEFYEEELRKAVRRGLDKWVMDTGILNRTNKQKKASDKIDLQDYLNKYAIKESHANAVEVKVKIVWNMPWFRQ